LNSMLFSDNKKPERGALKVNLNGDKLALLKIG